MASGVNSLRTRARGKYKRLNHLGRSGTRVIIDSFNIGFEVFVYNSRNFSIKLCEWLVKVSREFMDLV